MIQMIDEVEARLSGFNLQQGFSMASQDPHPGPAARV